MESENRGKVRQLPGEECAGSKEDLDRIAPEAPASATAAAPTTTKTVYGFLDFTTTVSDTLMIFKPSKTHAGGKGRNVGGVSRTASPRPANSRGNKNQQAKIESSRPVLEVSSTVHLDFNDEEEQPRNLAATSGGRGKTAARLRSSGEVHLESSMIQLDEPTTVSSPAKPATERLKALRQHTSSSSSRVDVSSRVDIRIGSNKLNGNSGSSSKTLPKYVEVRAEVNMEPEADQSKRRTTSTTRSTIVSKTTGTRIQNGITTVHETSVIGTTIDGQFAHFVQSTSRVFREPSTVLPPAVTGTVEVVNDEPFVNHLSEDRARSTTSNQVLNPFFETKLCATAKTTTPSENDETNLEALPSLESLFKSVNAGAEQEPPVAEKQVARSKTPVIAEPDDKTPAVVLKPSIRVSTAASPSQPSKNTSGSLERRSGVPSPSRLNQATSPRPVDQRWRYNPSPKPKVAIQRTSGSTGSRFRERITTPKDEPDYDPLPNDPEPEIDPTEVITLRVHTVTPEGYSNLYYEVATIKSPYIMRLGAVRNTRYVTLTRSFTRLVTPTPPPVAAISETALYDDLPDPEDDVLLESSQSLLPDPENILASVTPYESILKGSSDTATLPAIIVAATESVDSFKLQTVTETFSTTELTMKTSILPYLKAGSTSLITLTQSYYITRVVVAVKTVPPLEHYQFIPSKTLTDISTNLQEAGSEHNQAWSIQLLESSINGNPAHQLQQQQETPMLTPEQLQQLALFRFMNPYAAALPFGYPGMAGFGGANGGNQVIQTSRPVVRTLDVVRTETVPIWDGAKTIYSTITRVKGTTVVTETEYGTTTIPAPANPLFPQQFTVVSSPVVTEITTTSTELRIYRIIFRAQTTYTTVTSTTVFPTVITSYVSSTIPIQPTAFPQGLFPGSYGFPAFG
nr:EOG090X017N [Ilyocryptus agilis]